MILHCRWWCLWRGTRIARRLQRTFTYHLGPTNDRLSGIAQSDPGSWRRAGDLDEAGEYGRPDAIELTALGATTALGELDLTRVERARELGHERAIEGVCALARGGGRAVQHARELVCVLEDGARPRRVLGAVLEQRRERGRVLFEYRSCRLGRDVVYGGREGLATPDGCHSRISCAKEMLLDFRERTFTIFDWTG